MPPLSAVLLSSAPPLGASPSGPDLLLLTAVEWYQRLGVACELVRVPSAGEQDEHTWTDAVDRLAAADILVIALPPAEPDRGALSLFLDRVAKSDPQVVSEAEVSAARLAGTVACLIVDRPVDGSDPYPAMMLLRLSGLGAVLPPAAVCTEDSVESMVQGTASLAGRLGAPAAGFEGSSPAEESGLPRNLFGNLPTGALGIDPAAIEAERLATDEGRLYERRRMLDLTRPEKGLPENRRLPRPSSDGGPAEPSP